MSIKLSRKFYQRDSLIVAQELLGKYIVYNSNNGKLSARIVEVEAYIGKGDPACHASRGKTKRNEVMFGNAGFVYVYLIYGMYYCMNFVTEKKDYPAAVLIRACEIDKGFDIAKENNPKKNMKNILSGPGLFCKAFGITKEQNGIDLTGDSLYVETRDRKQVEIVSTSRIGISEGKEMLWRFYDKNSQSISGK